MAQAPARHSSALRNTCTVAAILGFGLVTGALLAETSLMSFRISRPSSFAQRPTGYGSQVNGYLSPSTSNAQSRRNFARRRPVSAHHYGI